MLSSSKVRDKGRYLARWNLSGVINKVNYTQELAVLGKETICVKYYLKLHFLQIIQQLLQTPLILYQDLYLIRLLYHILVDTKLFQLSLLLRVPSYSSGTGTSIDKLSAYLSGASVCFLVELISVAEPTLRPYPRL